MGNDTYREETNKSFETAKLTSYWLYLAGIPEAKEFGELINLEDEIVPEAIPHSEEMCFLNPIIHEIRYGSINYYIRQSGIKNILDIACGYSPRGLMFAEEGYHYVGADLPVVAEELSAIAAKTGLPGYEYIGADATNYASLKAAADRLPGPICVVVEGLGMYLTADDAAAVRRNIARIMSEHEGSVYVTTDPGNGYLFFDVITANYPPEKMRMMFGMLFEMYNWASDGGITMETDKRPLEADVALFKEAGLAAAPSPLMPGNPELLVYGKLSPDVVERLRAALAHPFTFVSALSADYSADNTQEESFAIEHHMERDTLVVKVSGRLDTLSAPQLLECFEAVRGQVKKVDIDCGGLTYLAASGTRVFRLIREELGGDDALVITGLRADLKKHLEDDEIIQHL